MAHKARFALSAVLILASGPAYAGFERAASAASAAFRQTIELPALSLLTDLKRVRALGDEDRLIDLLDDESPEVRAEAAKSLRHYALQSYRAEQKLQGVIDRGRELESVKREAIKSLAWAAQHYDTRRKILAVATDSGETPTLRAIALKSLYVVVSREYEVRRALQGILTDSSEPLAAREGAAWGLWSDAINDYDTRRKLVAVAQDSDEPQSLRVEAVKSLYSAMGHWEARNPVEGLAKDSSLKDPVREAAILCLHAVLSDWSVRSLLEDLSRNGPNTRIRTAAVKALQNGQSLELTRYFHVSFYLGRFIDPLEDQ